MSCDGKLDRITAKNLLFSVAGAGKNKSATTDVKFRTKTPVSKKLSYILRIKSHWKRRKCAKISAFR